MTSRRVPHVNDGSIRVAICITGLEVGGAEVFLSQLVAHRPADIEMKVFSLLEEGTLAATVRAAGIEVVNLDMVAGKPTLSALTRLTKELRRYRPDIVHTWMYHADLLGGMAAKLAGVRHVIWHIHNTDLSPSRVRRMTRVVVRALGVLSHSMPDSIISCSQRAIDVHVGEWGYAAERMRLIPNGVDTATFAPSVEARLGVREEFGFDATTPLIGLVARLDLQKNHEGFFGSVKRFYELGGNANFLLVGRDVCEGSWQLGVWRDATGHPERIVFAGPRTDIDTIMPAFDILTSSSLGEAFPMVLIEAMASGTPCVATNVGDSAQIVGETGVSVPPGDDEALAQAWLKLLALPAEERQLLGENARRRVEENFSLESVADQIWSLYRELASRR